MRHVRLHVHTGRPQAVRAARAVASALEANGIRTGDTLEKDTEIALVFGGDGTLLDAAAQSRGNDIPILGINLGHVGFLAEAEVEAFDELVNGVVSRSWTVEERMTLDATVTIGTEVHRGWALNEAVIEKGETARMIETALGVDGRPISTFSCDGIVVATPTGSTAYAFSGGGPVIWPDVEATVVVPIAAHALFTRPLVISPTSTLEVEVISDGAVIWCDGRRSLPAPPGAHLAVTRGAEPVRLARLSQAPFSGRLVRKFQLPVSGWRQGAGPHPREKDEGNSHRHPGHGQK